MPPEILEDAAPGSLIKLVPTVQDSSGFRAATGRTLLISDRRPNLAVAERSAPLVPGQAAIWDVAVGLSAPSTQVPGLRIALPLPAGTSLVSASGGGLLEDGHVVWDLRTLVSGEVALRQVELLIDPFTLHGSLVESRAYLSSTEDSAPAFADPGASITADGSGSSDPDSGISAYAWRVIGPCRAGSSLSDATLLVTINADAPIDFPSPTCVLELTVTNGLGLTATRGFDTVVLPSQYARAMPEAYIAYYGRPADPIGLHYWGVQLANANGALGALIGAYGTSPEYTSRFGGLNDEELINNLFRNLFGRDADSAGLQWYITERLLPYRQQWTADHAGDSTGATEDARSRIALDILYGALNDDRVIIDHKLEAARHFTEQVVRWGVTYDEPDIQIAVDALTPIMADPASVTAAKDRVDSVIACL